MASFASVAADIQANGARYRRDCWRSDILYMKYVPGTSGVVTFLGQKHKRDVEGRFIQKLRNGAVLNYELEAEDVVADDWTLVHTGTTTADTAAYYKADGTLPAPTDTAVEFNGTPFIVDVSNAVESVQLLVATAEAQSITILGSSLAEVKDTTPPSALNIIEVDTTTIKDGGSHTFTVVITEAQHFSVYTQITVRVSTLITFDAIADIAGGVAGAATYADAAAVIAALPETVTGNAGTVTIPVTEWVDTDTYNATAAAEYTFTATPGAAPAGYTLPTGTPPVVDVIVTAS